MKKVVSKIVAGVFFFASLISFGKGVDASSANQNFSKAEKTPLVLQHASEIFSKTNKTFSSSWHTSHYSHYSHQSHESHQSHQSHYSHYSGY